MQALSVKHDKSFEIVHPVKSVSFSPLKDTELKDYSVCVVDSPDLYVTKCREPKKNGINDPRMGTIQKNKICLTCKGTVFVCPGHFGYCPLTEYIYNPLFLSKTSMILNIVCSNCSYLLLGNRNKLQDCSSITKQLRDTRKNDKKLSVLYKHNSPKKIVCSRCGFKQSTKKYTKDGMIIAEIDVQTKERKKVYASDALKILSKISDDDILHIGMNPMICHPKDFICKFVPIVPPCVRPTINFGCNLRSEDDIVYKLVNILKANKSLEKKKQSSNQKYVEVYTEQLQWACTTLIDNNIKSIPQSQHRNNGRPLKCLKERIKGKNGRLRGNNLGKRVNFSARTVIDPDPEIDIHQVGIPINICKILTYPEKVNEFNKDRLTQLCCNGPNKYPGANYLFKASSDLLFDLHYARKSHFIFPQIGDTVHRHLCSEDSVIFNRQPSLHRMSMMSHKIFPMHGKSFRLNPAVTKPYNADFDGDEMNVIVPQNDLSMFEINMVAGVEKQIISPQSGTPIIGCIMDNIVGSQLLLESSLEKKEAIDLLLTARVFDVGQKNEEDFLLIHNLLKPDLPGNMISGKKVFSAILPQLVHHYHKHGLEIKHGKIIKGCLKKSTVGASADSLIHFFHSENTNTKTASEFINRIQRLTNRFLKTRGFSVGYDDIRRNSIIQKEKQKNITNSLRKVNDYIQKTFETSAKLSMKEFELYICNLLNEARDSIGNIVMENIDSNNSLYKMINSKSKGNVLNISQIMGSVGQQNLQWKGKQGRVPMIINNRTLPYFHQYDTSAKARGFIQNSYVDGLDAVEFFHHMVAGREGVIDTACKTADVGYLQRKLIKSLEDIKIHYDRTVRNEGNRIVQFTYGTIQMNTVAVQKQIISDIITLDKKKFNNKFMWTPENVRKYVFTDNITYNEIKTLCREEYFQLKLAQKHLIFHSLHIGKFHDTFLSNQSIENICQQQQKIETPLCVAFCIKETQQLLDELLIYREYHPFLKRINDHCLKYLKSSLRLMLSSKQLIKHRKMTKETFIACLQMIKRRFYTSHIEAGNAVGPIAAQSIGEPCTQLCVHYDTSIRIIQHHHTTDVKIGKFIDDLMQKNADRVVDVQFMSGDKKSQVLNIRQHRIMAFALDIDRNVSYPKYISEISRHEIVPNTKIIKVTTKSGKTVTTSLAHSFVKRNKEGKVEVIKGKDLSIGDKIPIIKQF